MKPTSDPGSLVPAELRSRGGRMPSFRPGGGSSSPVGKAPSAPGADIHVKVLTCPVMYVEEFHGRLVLERIAIEAGLTLDKVKSSSGWISGESLALFFEGVRALVDDDEQFKQACVYRLRVAYGPFAYLALAGTPTTVMKAMARTTSILAKHTHAEVLRESSNEVTLRYSSAKPEQETRLCCLSRQAQSVAMPTIFGLPEAVLQEHSCIAHGDDACQYTFSFYTRSTWWLAFLGAVLGVIVVLVLSRLTHVAMGLWIALPTCFGLVGALVEVRRTYQANLGFGDQLHGALREVALTEGETRREIMALHSRQKEWGRLLEEQVDERTNALRRVLGQLQSVGEKQVTNMRGFSHDLRNPLAVLSANSQYVRTAVRRVLAAQSSLTTAELNALNALRENLAEALDDNEHAIDSMERMLNGLLETLIGNRELVKVAPEKIEVAPQVDRLRRRMRALVYGRDIRVSVFNTREAPEYFETDPMVLERVIDNLCTNAAKYTERGSVVIELDGTPEFFILQVSDTGRGIEPDMLQQVLLAQGSDPARRAANSFGIGLSVTIQLLKQIGGRLEVDSKVGIGTTFWAYFPRRSVAPMPDNVVDIRRALAK